LGEHALRGLTRGENVFELAPMAVVDETSPPDLERPALPAVLAGRGPFVGRDAELDVLATEWATAMAGTARAMFVAGEPGVGKTRLAGEAARRAHDQGALVLYGRCDEELGAPYQPFAEALRALVGCVGPRRLQSVRGVEELARLVPELADLVPGLAAPAQASPDTERYALFDAMVRLLTAVSQEMPVVVVVDDLHWAAKPTLLLLRHLLRSAEGARVLILGTYRHTDLDRTHPLAGTLADLHRDGTAERLTLTGLGAGDVTEYLSAAGYDDEHLGAALSSVTSGNPFFLIEVLRHVEETGGAWDPSTLPQGVREAVGRRLSRLSDTANEALMVGAVAVSQFSIALVERVVGCDLVDAIGEACHAGLVVEEAGGWCRFNHALVRQSLLSEIASLKRVRLHQRIAEALEADAPVIADAHLADLARHYFECALAGGAAKAVDYSRRAAEQAMSRLAYEVAADFYDRALQVADLDASGVGEDERAELLLARCEALLAGGDPTGAIAVVEQLQRAARNSPRLSAWATCFAGQLAVLTHPERLDATERDVAAAAEQFALMDDADGEAKAHTVRASCLARLGRVADCEAALDSALTAGRRAGDPRRVNAVLAGAPLAALWGPSPVARASGRCLDVVRVLRITTGSAAVEAVALRCQAVLEALRGRTDAARRMLGSAHRSLESLGHTHGLLETDLFSGMVELLAGDAGAAEAPLRRAYDGFVARGVGVDAAQAAALLARAVLAQGRVEEALALTDDSERLAGVDLQSAIAWRAARAEALAQRGRTAEALEAARVAVALADPTDALIDQADAHLSLAIVLRAADSAAEAEREAQRAIALYERKGATARAEAVRLVLNPPASTNPASHAHPVPRRRVRPNRATDVEARGSGSFADRTVDQWLDRVSDDYVEVDHRTQVTTDRAAYARTLRMWARMEHFTQTGELLASLGERHALVRWTAQMDGAPLGDEHAGPVGAAEVVLLEVVRTDHAGRVVLAERSDNDELQLAIARLIELHADDELAPDRHDVQYRFAAQHRFATVDWKGDAVLVDHRHASLGTLQGSGAIEQAAAALQSLGADLRRRITDVVALTERVSLVEVVSEGTIEDGGPVEIAVLALTEFEESGGVRRWDWFGLDQLDEALASFDALVGAPEVSQLANMASVELRRMYDALLRSDFASTGAATAENAVLDDRRSLLGRRYEGRDAALAHQRSVVASGVTDVEVHVLATRGDRLVLERELYRGRDGETEVLFVGEFTPDHRWLGGYVFDPDDLDAAFDELDARYAAGEAAPFADAWFMATATAAAYNARDWDAFDGLYTGDFVCVDHQAVGRGTLDREAFLSTVRGLVELSPDIRLRLVEISRLGHAGSACVMRLTGTNESGGPIELEVLFVGLLRAGRTARLEYFAVDERAAACARFDALTAPRADSCPTNDAVRGVIGLFADMLRSDWDMFVGRASEEVVLDDRRRIVGFTAVGRDEVVRFSASVIGVGVNDIGTIPVATRGDRLALVRNLYVGSAGEAELLNVFEFDADGHWLACVSFDPDDLGPAFDELDARYAAGEAAACIETWAMMTATVADYNARDWDAFYGRLADDFVFVDQQTAGWGTLDGGAFSATLRGLIDLSSDVLLSITEIPRLGTAGTVFALRLAGTNETGGPFEIERLVLAIIRAGRYARLEFFAVEDRTTACDRLDALTTPTTNSYLTSDVPRRWSELMACFRIRDWDAFAARVAEAAAGEDRRTIVGGIRYEGRDGVVAAWQGIAAIGATDVELTLMATRGDHLALARTVYRGAAGEVEAVSVLEFDAAGRWVLMVAFDVADLDAAFDELDARYAAGEAARFVEAWAIATALTGSYAARDWTWMESLLTDDFSSEDHRPAGWGSLDRSGMIKVASGLVELSANVRLRIVAASRLSASGMVCHMRVSGNDATGGEFEIPFLALGVFAGHRIRNMEFFPFDDVAAALARFDSLVASDRAAADAYLTNDAARHWSELVGCFVASDWDGFAARLAVDTVSDDRRAVVGGIRYEGRDQVVALWKGIAAVGVTRVTSTPLAVRGSRLDLQQCVLSGAAAESEVLVVEELDVEGLRVRSAGFDPGDLDAAFAELDARYLAGEGALHVDTLGPMLEFLAAYNRQDWPRCRALLADDLTVIDHRPAPAVFGAIGGDDEFIGALTPLFDLGSGVCARALAIHVVDGGGVFRMRTTALIADGGEMDLAFHLAYAVNAGRLTHVELFDEAQLDAALACADGLAASSVPDDSLRNDAVRGTIEVFDHTVRSNWDWYIDGVADGVVLDDRRRYVAYTAIGREDVLRFSKAVIAIGVTDVSTVPVATRGARLALVRNVYIGSAGESEALNVFEFDPDGRWLALVSFDPDALDAAVAELDDRYAQGLHQDSTDAWATSCRFIDRYNARDADGLRLILADDCVIVDERLSGWGSLGRDAFLSHLQQLIGMAPDAVLMCAAVHTIAADGFVGRFRITGTVPGGGAFEMLFETVGVVSHGKLVRLELLPEGHVEAALRRLSEALT
ncbi:MAG: nuclear transport factor 2 family protein, partial [Acidimicrobiales bacterium]